LVGLGRAARVVRLQAVGLRQDGLSVEDLGISLLEAANRLVMAGDYVLASRRVHWLSEWALFHVDLDQRRLFRLPLPLSYGAGLAARPIAGQAALLVWEVGGQAWRVGLPPAVVSPLGDVGLVPGPATDGRWLLQVRALDAATLGVVARRIDGPAPGPERVVLRGSAIGGLRVLPGDIGVVEGDCDSDCFDLVDLTGGGEPVGLLGGVPDIPPDPTGRWLAVRNDRALMLLLLDDWPPAAHLVAEEELFEAFTPDGRALLVSGEYSGLLRFDIAGPGPTEPTVLVSPDLWDHGDRVLGLSAALDLAVVTSRFGPIPVRSVPLHPAAPPAVPTPLALPSDLPLGLTPDGRAVWFLRYAMEPGGRDQAVMVRLDEDGDPLAVVLPDRWTEASVAPDGRLLFQVRETVPPRLVRTGPDGPEDLLSPDLDVGRSDPATLLAGPGGRVLLFQAAPSVSRPLLAVRPLAPAGEAVREVAAAGYVATLTDDGERVVYESSLPGQEGLRSARLDGADAPEGVRLGPVVSRLGAYNRPLRVAQRSRWVAWAGGEGPTTLLAPADGSWEGATAELAAPSFLRSFPLGFAADDLLLVQLHAESDDGRRPSRHGLACVRLGPDGPAEVWEVLAPAEPRFELGPLAASPLVVLRRLTHPEAGRDDAQHGWFRWFAARLDEPDNAWPTSREFRDVSWVGASLLGLPGGDRLLVRWRHEGRDVLEVSLTDGSNADAPVAVPLPEGAATVANVHIHPTGGIAASIAGETLQPDVYVLSPDGEPPRRVTPLDGRGERLTGWSPDGGWVLTEGLEGYWLGVRAADATGSVSATLLSLPDRDVRPVVWVEEP